MGYSQNCGSLLLIDSIADPYSEGYHRNETSILGTIQATLAEFLSQGFGEPKTAQASNPELQTT